MKHFNAVSTTEFSDGQAFYDILKVSDQRFNGDFSPRPSKSVHSALCCRSSSQELLTCALHRGIYSL